MPESVFISKLINAFPAVETTWPLTAYIALGHLRIFHNCNAKYLPLCQMKLRTMPFWQLQPLQIEFSGVFFSLSMRSHALQYFWDFFTGV